MLWLSEHWGAIAIAIAVVVNVLNAITPHFDQYAGAKRWLMIVVDVLSVFASADSSRRLKLPLVTDKRVP